MDLQEFARIEECFRQFHAEFAPAFGRKHLDGRAGAQVGDHAVGTRPETLDHAVGRRVAQRVALAVHRQLVRNQIFDTAPLHTFRRFATVTAAVGALLISSGIALMAVPTATGAKTPPVQHQRRCS